MTTIVAFLDRSAIGLSFVCVLHCLAVPLMIILAPSLVLLPFFGDERIHLLLVFLVLPTSTVALTLGCRQHGLKNVLCWGFAGIAILILAVALGEKSLGGFGEAMLTVVGSILVAIGHIINFKCCRSASCNHGFDKVPR